LQGKIEFLWLIKLLQKVKFMGNVVGGILSKALGQEFKIEQSVLYDICKV
jgi:hypothetical protein